MERRKNDMTHLQGTKMSPKKKEKNVAKVAENVKT